MKTIILIIAITGFTTLESYAQNNKCNCDCKKKAVHHRVAYHRKTTTKKTTPPVALTQDQPIYTLSLPVVLNNNVCPPPVSNVCVYDNNGDMNYIRDTSFLGYYPENPATPDCEDIEALLMPRYKDLIVTSTAFTDNGVLPGKYTCEGEQVSPPLNVVNIPAGTKSLAVVMYDSHSTANKSTTYWLMWDLDTTGNIPENFINDHSSRNPYSMQYGYEAVCPLAGTHYYHFKVYALDTKLLLGKNTNRLMLEKAMAGHVLARGEITSVFNRHLD